MLVARNRCHTKRSPTSQEGSVFQHQKDQPLPVTSEICGKCGPEIFFNLLNLYLVINCSGSQHIGRLLKGVLYLHLCSMLHPSPASDKS